MVKKKKVCSKEKWPNRLNLLAPIIMFIIGLFILKDKTPVYFLIPIWLTFSLIPAIIAKKSKWKLKRKDLFTYRYSEPLITGIIVTSLFFILNLTIRDRLTIIFMLIIFIILYAYTHWYISNKYPTYYFK